MNVTALDESGKPVDWFFIYKVPQLASGLHEDSATGYEYVYFDATMEKKGGTVARSPYRLDQGKGALNLTLNSAFNKPADTTGWILYNDELPPDVDDRSDDGNLGHTKGVLAFDTASGTGFWLLHSWPKFTAPQGKQEPTPKYGQTYLCLSLDLETLRKIATLMVDHQEPQTYLCRAAKLTSTDPLKILMTPLQPATKPAANSIELKTAGGMDFTVIAKNRAWNQDFWNGLVGPILKDDINVDTWIRGEIPPVADTDGIHKTFDIKFITMGPLGIHWAWPETHDHAKWGITKKLPWVCVGDINRMVSQRKRGGGAIAFQNQTLWQALSKTDLILAPPGHSRAQAHKIMEASHGPATPQRAKAAPKKKPAVKRKA